MDKPKYIPALGVIVLAILATLLALVTRSVARGNADVREAAGLRILHSDETGILLELNTPDYITSAQVFGDEVYQLLEVPGLDMMQEPGRPQLPVMNLLLGVPADAQVKVRVIAVEKAPMGQGFNLPLALYPAPLQDDLRAGEWYPLNEIPYTLEEINLYPAQEAVITGDAWLRDQRIVRLALYPFQYQAQTDTLTWNRQLQVEVIFETTAGGSQGSTVSASQEDVTFEAILEQALVNYDAARAWRGMPEAGFVRETSVEGPRLRIVVTEDGLYRVGYQDIVDAGWNPEEIDPKTLYMSNQGREVAVYVYGEEDHQFGPGDYVLFYGEAFRGEWMASWYSNEADLWSTFVQQRSDGSSVLWHPEFTASMMEKYTAENVYWLLDGVSPNPPRMVEIDGTPGSAPVPETYWTTQRSEVQRYHWEYHYTSEDTWFMGGSTGGNIRSFPTTLSAISPESFSAVVRAEVVSFNYNNNASPDHHTKFWINNLSDPIDDAYWDGRSRYSFETQVLSADLLEGVNTLQFQALTGVASQPWIYIDWFEIEYARLFQAYESEIHFPGNGAGTWRYEVDNFGDETLYVLDVTNPLLPARVLNVSVSSSSIPSAFQGVFQLAHGESAQYYMASATAVRIPDSISYYVPPDLRSSSNGADHLIIAHADFLAEAQRLANYRTSQGLRTLVVNVDDLYNEFNEGIYHPIAIKNFLQYTFAHWQLPAPRYVVLVGDGNWELDGVNSFAPGTVPIFMPPNLSWVDAWQGEVDSSNLLATIVGNDPLPDVLISRIPVNNVEQLSAVIDKIIQFEAYPTADWQMNNLFITDNTPDSAGDFVAQAEEIIANHIPDDFASLRVYTNDYKNVIPSNCGTSPYPGGPSCPNVNLAITNVLNGTGAQFASYIGHGAVQRWAGEQIWLYHLDDPANPNDRYYSDFDNLENQGMLPVVLSMTCLDGYWFHPSLQPSLAEVFLWTPNAGAVAIFSPTGLGVSTGHDVMQRGFFDAVYQSGVWELGSATLAGKIALYNFSSYTELMHTYNTYGDSALRLHSPYGLALSPEEAHTAALAGSSVTYTLTVTNTGAIADTFALTVAGHAWQTILSQQSVVLAANQSAEISVTVAIPADALGGAIDVAQVSVISQGDRGQTKNALLETTANVYGLAVSPPSIARTSLPGSVVTYTLNIINTSNTTDTFSVSVAGNLWPTTPDLLEVGPLVSGEQTALSVVVAIPSLAQDYETDRASVVFVSQSDPLRSAVARLATTARTFGLDVSPSFQYGSGRVDTAVTYTVWIKNTGGYPDTFDVSATSGLGWEVAPAATVVGPLNPGEQVSLEVTVYLPADAAGGTRDTTTVQAISQGQPVYQDNSLLYTTANVYGIAVFAPISLATDLPANSVTYTVTLTNLGNAADVFDLTIGAHDWETTVSQISPQVIGGGSVDIIVQVNIPASANPHQMDIVTLQWVSRADPGQSAQVTLTTISQVGGYLPMLFR